MTPQKCRQSRSEEDRTRPVPTSCATVVASHDASPGDRNTQVTYAAVWVSDPAAVVRSRQNEDLVEGLLLKAKGGEPWPRQP